jgi:FAD/FMN-containing dehydrogenase
MPRIVLDFVLKHIGGTRDPFARPQAWYVLLEISGLSADGTAERVLLDILAQGKARGAIGAATLARAFWRLREAISEAQKFEGGNIKNDVAVPIAKIPEFIARADAAVLGLCPGARTLAFGHFGDGNVHYNISQPPALPRAQFEPLWQPIQAAVNAVSLACGGSISVEHGIGDEARGAPRRAQPGRTGADAGDQGGLRPQGHTQSRQGAVSGP